MSVNIAYLGPVGTFTEEALQELCTQIFAEPDRENTYTLISKQTIPDCLTAAQNGEVDYAMVPMENSIEGSVNMTLDWLIHQIDIPIQAEFTMQVRQNALIHRENIHIKRDDIQMVYSHPHAIAQCHAYLREHCPNARLEYMRSTAEAAEWIASHPQEKSVAIASKRNAQLFQLHVREAGIEDHPNNFTRFVLVGPSSLEKSCSYPEDTRQSGKSSLLVMLPEDFPGALHQVLAVFSWRKLNLSRIESRPTKKGLGHYYFFIDVEKQMDAILLPGAISELQALGCQVRFLGSYPCFYAKKMSKMPTNA